MNEAIPEGSAGPYRHAVLLFQPDDAADDGAVDAQKHKVGLLTANGRFSAHPVLMPYERDLLSYFAIIGWVFAF